MSAVTVEKVEEPKQPPPPKKKHRKRLFTNRKRKNKQTNKNQPNKPKSGLKKDMTLIYEPKLSVREWSSRRMVIVSE